MFFCYDTTHTNDKNTIINSNNLQDFDQDEIPDQKSINIQDNTNNINMTIKPQQSRRLNHHALYIPNSIVRASSSLTKISQSNKKQQQKQQQQKQQKVSKFELPSSSIKKQNYYNNDSKRTSCDIKNQIFNKLKQKNQTKSSSISSLVQNNINNSNNNNKNYNILNNNNNNNNNNNILNHNNKQNKNQYNNNYSHKQSIQNIIPSSSSQIPSNFYHKHQNLNKIYQILQQNKQKQLKQCTFNPKTNSHHNNNSTSHHNNNTQQFYQYQLNYYKKTQDKIQKIRQLIQNQKQKQTTFKPKISTETQKLTTRRSKINVYDRLYDEKYQNKQKYQQNQKMHTERQQSKDNVNRQIGRNNNNSKQKVMLRNKSNLKQQQNQMKKYHQNFPYWKQQDTINKNHQLKSQSQSNQKGLKTFREIMNSQEKNQSSINHISSVKKNYKNINEIIANNKNNNNNKYTPSSSLPKNQKQPNNHNRSRQYLNCQQLLHKKQSQNFYNNILSNRTSKQLLNPAPTTRPTYVDPSNFLPKKTPSIPLLKQQPKLTSKSQSISLQKLLKQILTVISHLHLPQKIQFTEMLYFLQSMNFIQNVEYLFQSSNNNNEQRKEKQFLFQIWNLLQGNQREIVLVNNVIKIIIALMGYHKSNVVQNAINNVKKNVKLQQQQCQNNQNNSQIMLLKQWEPYFQYFNDIDNKTNKLKQGILILSQKDSKTLKKDFMCLCMIRLKLGQSKLSIRHAKQTSYSFKPQISKTSQQLAQKYRQRILQQSQNLLNQGLIYFPIPQNGQIDHQTLLLLDQKIKQYKLQKLREQKQQQKRKIQQQSMVQYTSTDRSGNSCYYHQRSKDNHSYNNINGHSQSYYQNQSNNMSRISQQNQQNQQNNSRIINKNSSYQTSSRRSSNNQVFQNLYQHGKRSLSNKRDKSINQIQYEQNKKQCTFSPMINKSPQIKGFYDQNINNNKSSRLLHENIPNFTKQVMRMQKNKKSNHNSHHNDNSPLLYLNVTMQGLNSVKIPVYQNDDFHTLTEKVRQLMNISNGQEQKIKLKNILKEQIIPVLEKIGIKKIKEGAWNEY